YMMVWGRTVRCGEIPPDGVLPVVGTYFRSAKIQGKVQYVFIRSYNTYTFLVSGRISPHDIKTFCNNKDFTWEPHGIQEDKDTVLRRKIIPCSKMIKQSYSSGGALAYG